jgi:hypothetical protein
MEKIVSKIFIYWIVVIKLLMNLSRRVTIPPIPLMISHSGILGLMVHFSLDIKPTTKEAIGRMELIAMKIVNNAYIINNKY